MIRHTIMEVRSALNLRLCLPVAAVALAAFAVTAPGASAASMRVKAACASDYFAHCSKFNPNSQQTRDCMNNVGEGLSKRCVNALVADGEVSNEEVAARTPRHNNDDE